MEIKLIDKKPIYNIGLIWEINNKIGIEQFDGCTLGLLGDIHKYQYMNPEKTVAYPGSLIQQNHADLHCRQTDPLQLNWALPYQHPALCPKMHQSGFYWGCMASRLGR